MAFKKIETATELERIALAIRRDVIRSLAASGSGHLGGSLGLADVFTVLYFNRMRHDPERPDWPERDRLVLSVGHVAPVYYAALAHAGYFPVDELLTLRKLGSRLQGHPGRDHLLPGIELSAGSLGQGLPVAVGMALANKLDGNARKTFCINGDGELQEGSIWEAAMSAAHHKLDNLITTVDRNHVQIDGEVQDVMDIEPLAEKWKSFGWEVFECDGNDISDLLRTYRLAEGVLGKPSVVIAHTAMGRGVKEIEGDYRWHGKAPSAEQAEAFLVQLEQKK
ncbi:MAG: transketolase [Bacteroidota bacterium]